MFDLVRAGPLTVQTLFSIVEPRGLVEITLRAVIILDLEARRVRGDGGSESDDYNACSDVDYRVFGDVSFAVSRDLPLFAVY